MVRGTRTKEATEMTKRWITRTSLLMAIGSASLALSSMPAAAATQSTPNGDVGGCNMLLSFLPSGSGMGLAMNTDNALHGNTGMFGAVAASTGSPTCS